MLRSLSVPEKYLEPFSYYYLLLVINYFRRKAPSLIFYSVLNTSLAVLTVMHLVIPHLLHLTQKTCSKEKAMSFLEQRTTERYGTAALKSTLFLTIHSFQSSCIFFVMKRVCIFVIITAQIIKFSVIDFFNKCEQSTVFWRFAHIY